MTMREPEAYAGRGRGDGRDVDDESMLGITASSF